ncbi:hypothetical protein [Thermofilum sp.]|uniref:hypothetical protein n=1 Tax=Thermofilum sp. TaxID=1961369 RepID=UPI003169DF4F
MLLNMRAFKQQYSTRVLINGTNRRRIASSHREPQSKMRSLPRKTCRDLERETVLVTNCSRKTLQELVELYWSKAIM